MIISIIMNDLIINPWTSAIIIFILQMVFILFRTINVIYTAEKKVLASILTGNIIGVCWLASIFLGIDAIMNLLWQPIVAYFIGGSLGQYLGFKIENFGFKIKNINRS